MINKILVLGRLVTEPVKRDAGTTVVCTVALAINEKIGKGRERTCFIDVDFWGDNADTVVEYCNKGSLLFVDGALLQDRWETDDGKRSKHKLRAYRIQLMDGISGNGKKESKKEDNQDAVVDSDDNDNGDVPF